MESCWSNGKPAYRCRHGRTSATRPDPARPRNAYIREDQILPRLPALAILLGAATDALSGPEQGTAHAAPVAEVIGYLRASRITLTYDPGDRVLRARTQGSAAVTLGRSHEH
jgi:site-specific DNA recombinase